MEEYTMAYFLISVSNKENLKLCMKYKMAGFTNSVNGFWTFVEVDEGDYISFLYGARVYNLYKVIKKVVLKNANKYGPWSPITFKSGNTYYFPFRLHLQLVRKFEESMVRQEFAYVAENLLLRGGYRKTHFQADEVTFYQVSQMGEKVNDDSRDFEYYPPDDVFTPKITFNNKLQVIPEVFSFKELILQSLVRKFLSKNRDIFCKILQKMGIDGKPQDFEILGEKALPEGHVDIFIKEKHPKGTSKKIVIEVKRNSAKNEDFEQLKKYMDELGNECMGGILIAKSFSKRLSIPQENILCLTYKFENVGRNNLYTYDELLTRLQLQFLERWRK
ncbi:endonuclease NucS domain-containing protein [Methanotorris igneus]|nr:endonuclease NucS domain-containing protein [Methanotorris igneus]